MKMIPTTEQILAEARRTFKRPAHAPSLIPTEYLDKKPHYQNVFDRMLIDVEISSEHKQKLWEELWSKVHFW